MFRIKLTLGEVDQWVDWSTKERKKERKRKKEEERKKPNK